MNIAAINPKYNINKLSFGKQFSDFDKKPSIEIVPYSGKYDKSYANIMRALINVGKRTPSAIPPFINSSGYILNEFDPDLSFEVPMKLGRENIIRKVSRFGETQDNVVMKSHDGDYYCINKNTLRIDSAIKINKNNPNDHKFRFYDDFGNIKKEYILDTNDIPDDENVMNLFANSKLVLEFFRELGVNEDLNFQRALDLDFFDSLVHIAKKGEARLDIFRSYNTVANKHQALRDQQISKFMFDLKNAYFNNLFNGRQYIDNKSRISSFNETLGDIDDGLFLGYEKNKYLKKENHYKYTSGLMAGRVVSSNELRKNLIYELNQIFSNQNKDEIRQEFGKVGLVPLMDEKYITGIDGLINPKTVDLGSHFLLKTSLKNFYNAKIVLRDEDEKTKRFIEGVFSSFPELESIKGKKQPRHKNTIDSEIINSLSYLINNSEFRGLDDSLKKTLVLCTILQDLSSDECGRNFNHSKTSYTYAKDILENIKKNGGDITDDEINLTCKLIYYHDWFDYSTAKKTNNPPIKVNTLLSYLISRDSKLSLNGEKVSAPEISKMLNMIAEANILGMSDKINDKFKNYKDEYDKNFEDEYEKAKYFTLRQASPKYDFSENSKTFERVNVQGDDIYVVKDENFPISVHMTKDLETMYNLANANYSDIQSCSILTSKSSGTAWGLSYGFLISYDKEDVILEASKDLDSGYNKNIYMSKIFLYPEKILHTMTKALMFELGERSTKEDSQELKKTLEFLDSPHFNSLPTDKKMIVVGKLLERYDCSTFNASRAMKSEIDERNRNQNEMLINNFKIESAVIKGTAEGMEKDLAQMSELIGFAKNNNLKIVYLPYVKDVEG